MDIEEQMRDAEEAPETEIKLEETEPLTEMSPLKMKSAGYVYVYDTRTNERSVCNRNMLAKMLRKKRPDGSIVFTTAKPKTPPARGTLKCMLHPDSPNRKHYDEMGLATCRKSNLTSPYQVRRHMEKRHKMEWATIKEETDREYLMNLDYTEHLWLEKEIKSVANITRKDVIDFLELAAEIPVKPEVQEFSLEEANSALAELKERKIRGAKVLKIG